MRTILPAAAILAGTALALGACNQSDGYDSVVEDDTAAMPADNSVMDTNTIVTDDVVTNDVVTDDMTTNDVDETTE